MKTLTDSFFKRIAGTPLHPQNDGEVANSNKQEIFYCARSPHRYVFQTAVRIAIRAMAKCRPFS